MPNAKSRIKRAVSILLGSIARFRVSLFGTRRVVVLAYHSINNDPWIHAVTPETFEQHLVWLAKNATVISLEELDRRIEKREFPKTKRPTIAITFDDGYADWVEYAAPLLKQHKMPATFFVTTSFAPVTNEPHPGLSIITLAQVRTLSVEGFEIGSHGHTHHDFSTLDEQGVREECETSMRILADLTGKPVRFLTYPKGRFNPNHAQMLERLGIKLAFGGHGSVDSRTDRFAAPRIPVIKPMDRVLFASFIYCAL